MLTGKIKLAGLLVAALLPVAGLTYWYVGNLQNKLDIAKANEVKLELAISQQEETIDKLKQDSVCKNI